MRNQRRVEFRKADKADQALIKGSTYLLLGNSDRLSKNQEKKLENLLNNNTNLNTIYLLKEQLQAIWSIPTYEGMETAINQWCRMAQQSDLLYIKKFAKSLQWHKVGICNYAKHHLTSARIEALNVSIGMIRKRARGVRDTEYFKLKIRQISTVDNGDMFYKNTAQNDGVNLENVA